MEWYKVATIPFAEPSSFLFFCTVYELRRLSILLKSWNKIGRTGFYDMDMTWTRDQSTSIREHGHTHPLMKDLQLLSCCTAGLSPWDTDSLLSGHLQEKSAGLSLCSYQPSAAQIKGPRLNTSMLASLFYTPRAVRNNLPLCVWAENTEEKKFASPSSKW